MRRESEWWVDQTFGNREEDGLVTCLFVLSMRNWRLILLEMLSGVFGCRRGLLKSERKRTREEKIADHANLIVQLTFINNIRSGSDLSTEIAIAL
jgi:hypothetical protein